MISDFIQKVPKWAWVALAAVVVVGIVVYVNNKSSGMTNLMQTNSSTQTGSTTGNSSVSTPQGTMQYMNGVTH